MFTKRFLAALLLTAGATLTGCAADTDTDTDHAGDSDSFAATDTTTEAGDNVAIARGEVSRGCTSSELGAAQAHANANHSYEIFIPMGTGSTHPRTPTITSCQVSNGYIVYTYTQPW